MNHIAFEALNAAQLYEKALSVMEEKAIKNQRKVFLAAVMAGVFIGLGFVYCAMANVAGAGKIVGGLVFSLGLMLVVVCGGDLFTSSTLTLIPRAHGSVTWRQVFVNWSVVYAGNFVGSILLVTIVLLSGHPWESGGNVALFYINTTAHKLDHTFVEAVFLGILCNLMVCLGVWMSYAGRSLLDKMAACLLPVGLFIACGFEHSVANMFMIPMGIICGQIMPPEVAAKLASPHALTSELTWWNFLIKNLIPVTLGNIIGGGILVGLYQWNLHSPRRNKQSGRFCHPENPGHSGLHDLHGDGRA